MAFGQSKKANESRESIPVVDFVFDSKTGCVNATLPAIKSTDNFIRFGGRADETRTSSNVSLYFAKSDDERADEIEAFEISIKPVFRMKGKAAEAPKKKGMKLS